MIRTLRPSSPTQIVRWWWPSMRMIASLPLAGPSRPTLAGTRCPSLAKRPSRSPVSGRCRSGSGGDCRIRSRNAPVGPGGPRPMQSGEHTKLRPEDRLRAPRQNCWRPSEVESCRSLRHPAWHAYSAIRRAGPGMCPSASPPARRRRLAYVATAAVVVAIHSVAALLGRRPICPSSCCSWPCTRRPAAPPLPRPESTGGRSPGGPAVPPLPDRIQCHTAHSPLRPCDRRGQDPRPPGGADARAGHVTASTATIHIDRAPMPTRSAPTAAATRAAASGPAPRPARRRERPRGRPGRAVPPPPRPAPRSPPRPPAWPPRHRRAPPPRRPSPAPPPAPARRAVRPPRGRRRPDRRASGRRSPPGARSGRLRGRSRLWRPPAGHPAAAGRRSTAGGPPRPGSPGRDCP